MIEAALIHWHDSKIVLFVVVGRFPFSDSGICPVHHLIVDGQILLELNRCQRADCAVAVAGRSEPERSEMGNGIDYGRSVILNARDDRIERCCIFLYVLILRYYGVVARIDGWLEETLNIVEVIAARDKIDDVGIGAGDVLRLTRSVAED